VKLEDEEEEEENGGSDNIITGTNEKVKSDWLYSVFWTVNRHSDVHTVLYKLVWKNYDNTAVMMLLKKSKAFQPRKQ
jgi:hypothetical protein